MRRLLTRVSTFCVWAYRYRVGGRSLRRVQQGGFELEQAAADALERALATFALRAGISTFELSRHMGRSLGMIDRRSCELFVFRRPST